MKVGAGSEKPGLEQGKKMKVVYNAYYGGFGISRKCAEWLANRGNTECIEKLEEYNKEGTFRSTLYDTSRHDTLLVMAIEALGAKASGSSANLLLHELKGDRYKIEEYDGFEEVIEPEDIEWVKV